MLDIIKSLGEMTRFAIRMRNKHPELVSKIVSEQIDNAQKIISNNSDIAESKIFRHQENKLTENE